MSTRDAPIGICKQSNPLIGLSAEHCVNHVPRRHHFCVSSTDNVQSALGTTLGCGHQSLQHRTSRLQCPAYTQVPHALFGGIFALLLSIFHDGLCYRNYTPASSRGVETFWNHSCLFFFPAFSCSDEQRLFRQAVVAGSVVLVQTFLNRETRDSLTHTERSYLHESFTYTGGGLALTALGARSLFKSGFAFRVMAANPCKRMPSPWPSCVNSL
jgi:hypothetical protein